MTQYSSSAWGRYQENQNILESEKTIFAFSATDKVDRWRYQLISRKYVKFLRHKILQNQLIIGDNINRFVNSDDKSVFGGNGYFVKSDNNGFAGIKCKAIANFGGKALFGGSGYFVNTDKNAIARIHYIMKENENCGSKAIFVSSVAVENPLSRGITTKSSKNWASATSYYNRKKVALILLNTAKNTIRRRWQHA